MIRTVFPLIIAVGLSSVFAQELETKPAEAYFEKFQPKKGPAPKGLVLQKGDRLAICGDSITEQKMYSRVIETYLTVAVPELDVTVRQYGWSGETAPGFLARMTVSRSATSASANAAEVWLISRQSLKLKKTLK